MPDVVLGLLALLIGAAICFRGFLAMRILISIWGAFAGFALGAGLVDRFSDAGFLRSFAAWTVAVILSVAFAAFAYLYYEVSVLVAMGAIGFTLGTSAMVAIGVSWSWLIISVGLLVGIVLAALAIAGDLPTTLLAVLTALSGASTIVFGVMLLVGTIDTADFGTAALTEQPSENWGWYVLYAAVAIGGLISQFKYVDRMRATLREEWNATT